MVPYKVLRHRGFRDLFIGQSVSQLGDALYYVVFMFMVKKITGSDAMVGLVGAAEMLPFVLFSGYGGVLADRIDRKAILFWTDIACMAILLSFGILVFATGMPPLWSIFVTASLLSTCRAFFYPAKNACIPNLVPADETLEANTLNSMSFNLFFTAGLAVSTLVLSSLYSQSPTVFFGVTVLLNAVSFAASAVYIWRMPSVIADRGGEEPHPWTDFKEGLRYMAQRRVLTVLMIAGLFMSLAIAPFFVAYMAANDQWFGGKPQTVTFFELSFFLGMIFGSMAVARVRMQRVGLGYALGLGVTGLMVAVMAFSPVAWQFSLWNFVCGLFVPFADIPVQTYVQVKVEDAFRGRVNSAWTMLRNGMTPIGMAMGGLLIERIGLVNMFLLMGLGMATVAALSLSDKAFRESTLAPEEDSGKGPSGPRPDWKEAPAEAC